MPTDELTKLCGYFTSTQDRMDATDVHGDPQHWYTTVFHGCTQDADHDGDHWCKCGSGFTNRFTGQRGMS